MINDLLDFYTNASLLELGAEADRVRREKHPHNTVTYIVDRNINYTNVCVADCGFCAFYRRPKHHEGWTLSYEQIGAKIEEAKELGAIQILMQGGHNPYIPFEWYLDLLRYIKRNHPIHIHGFSPSEVDFFAKTFHVSPFMPMARGYDWRFSEPAEALRVHMNVLRDGGRDFDATLVLQRRPFDGTQLARVLWRFPLMTLKVVAAIHWEALRLWLKRNPVYDHPHHHGT